MPCALTHYRSFPNEVQKWWSSLPLDQAVDLVKDAFISAGERDIYTGDDVEILIITKDGIRRDSLALKRD